MKKDDAINWKMTSFYNRVHSHFPFINVLSFRSLFHSHPFSISGIMHQHSFFFTVKITVIGFTFFLGSVLSADWHYEVCEPQNCGSGPNISFPFRITNGGSDGEHKSDFCGYKGFEVICNVDKPVFRTANDDYIIQDISYTSQSLKLINAEFSGTTCLAPLRNFSSDRFKKDPDKYSADYFLYLIPNRVANLYFFYNCTTPNDTNFTLTCAANATDLHSFAVLNPDSSYETATAQMCSSYVWQTVDWDPSKRNNYTKLVMGGLTARWSEPTGTSCPKCERSGGRCGMKYNGVICYCPDGDHPWHCHDNELSKRGLIGIAAAFGGIVMIITLAFCCCAKNCLVQKSLVIWKDNKHTVFSFLVKIKSCICSYQSSVRKKSRETVLALVVKIKCSICSHQFNIWKKKRDDKQVEDFLRNCKFEPRRYSYADIKRMTASFADKLGEGGFGDVYKGKLHDGTQVAVKVLNKSKSNGEDFINELASISRTSHVNIVDLLGFCFEGSRRALIFEFMSKGSLDKYITDSNDTNSKLGWKVMYQISIGIARGLEYLHRGCNARILHFDIKPPNILLDEDFCPKISDFGLAKLCPRKESSVVMSKGKGTAGYVAPEVYYNVGGVSHKSDVYSYGMMISEMVGRRKNFDANAGHTSQIYFPKWIYRRVEQDEELGLGDMDEEEKEYARKMIMVSLWCIQTEPSHRPTIREVLSMLEGSVESLKMPPRPFLCSPPRSEANSSTFESEIS